MHTCEKVEVVYTLSHEGTALVDVRLEDGSRTTCFMLDEREVEQALRGWSTFQDILRRIEVIGDRTVVYSIEGMQTVREDHGTLPMRYDRFRIPLHAWKILLRYGHLAKREMLRQRAAAEAGGGWAGSERIVLRLGRSRRCRWEMLYGWGKGQVDVRRGDGVLELMAGHVSEPGFSDGVAHVHRIAVNSTKVFWERARVSWFKDGKDFYWEAFRPSGERIMNGGLNQHDGRWSLNT